MQGRGVPHEGDIPQTRCWPQLLHRHIVQHVPGQGDAVGLLLFFVEVLGILLTNAVGPLVFHPAVDTGLHVGELGAKGVAQGVPVGIFIRSE